MDRGVGKRYRRSIDTPWSTNPLISHLPVNIAGEHVSEFYTPACGDVINSGEQHAAVVSRRKVLVELTWDIARTITL